MLDYIPKIYKSTNHTYLIRKRIFHSGYALSYLNDDGVWELISIYSNKLAALSGANIHNETNTWTN